jgi:undecaprenyl diphosphate synthase
VRLKYFLSWVFDDAYVYLRWISPRIQYALRKYTWAPVSTFIIPDGNRRFSRKVRMSHVVEWHREWVKRVEDIVVYLRKKRSNVIDEVIFWWLSRQNAGRSKEELEGLFTLLREAQPRLLKIGLEHKIHIFMIGDTSLLPSDIVQLMQEISDATSKYHSAFRCALALAYDAEGEINRQADILVSDGFQGDQSALRNEAFSRWHSWLRIPDLLIRTGSDARPRTSGALIGWNTTLCFFRAFWPTITTAHIDFALHMAIMTEINNGK